MAEVRGLAGRMLDEVERAVVGKRDALELVLLGLLADGHVLLDDYPGLAKTLIARSFAQVTSLRFARFCSFVCEPCSSLDAASGQVS